MLVYILPFSTMATRHKRAEALLHLLTDVLELDPTREPLVYDILSGAGIKSINDIFDNYSLATFLELQDPSSGLRMPDLIGKKVFRAHDWLMTQENQSVLTWFSLNADVFDEYLAANRSFALDESSIRPSVLNSSYDSYSNPSRDFLKGIKRDPDAYPVFTDDSQWLVYDAQLTTQAASHDIIRVFDGDTVPPDEASDPEDYKLWHAENNFAYLVLTKSLKTPRSRRILRDHKVTDKRATRPAHEIYKALCAEYTTGATNDLRVQQRKEAWESHKLGKDHNTSYASWMASFDLKLLNYEDAMDANVPDDERNRVLRAAVQGNPEMLGVVTNSNTVALTSGKPKLTFDELRLLFQNHMEYSDKIHERKKPGNNRSTPRKANKAETSPGQKSDKATKDNKSQNNNNNNNNNRNTNNRNTSNKTGGYVRLPKEYKIPPADFEKMTGLEIRRQYEERRKLFEKDQKENKLKKAQFSLKVNTSSTTTSSTTETSGDGGGGNNDGDDSAKPGSAISRMMNKSLQKQGAADDDGFILIGGKKYKACASKVRLNFSKCNEDDDNTPGALVDRGANGGLAGADVLVLAETNDKAEVSGIFDNTASDLPICSVAALINSADGPIIGVMHNYAYTGQGHSIHSSLQLEHFGANVDERSSRLPSEPGTQSVTTIDGHVIPLLYHNGLPYMPMRPPTEAEMEDESIPQVDLTSIHGWDPSVFDDDDSSDVHKEPASRNLREIASAVCDSFAANVARCIYAIQTRARSKQVEENEAAKEKKAFHAPKPLQPLIKPRNVKAQSPDFAALRQHFAWLDVDRIKATLANTTQLFQQDKRIPLRRHYKKRFSCDMPRTGEDVATDTLFSDTPAADDGILGHGGCTMLQVFSGVTSRRLTGVPMKSESEVAAALETAIREWQMVPLALKSDNAKAEIGKEVLKILNKFAIAQKRSEPYYQNQNPCERSIQDLKRMTNELMDRLNIPAEYWLLVILYLIYLLNRVSRKVLNGLTPLEKSTGIRPDISALLHYRFWEPVFVLEDLGKGFPSESKEAIGRWVGVAENIGDVLTHWVLLENGQVIPRSDIRSALDAENPNYRAGTLDAVDIVNAIEDDESIPPPDGGEFLNYSDGDDDLFVDERVKIKTNDNGEPTEPRVKSFAEVIAETVGSENPSDVKLPQFSPDELLGATFLKENGENTYRYEVVRKIEDMDAENHKNLKFLIQYGGGVEEIISYVELCDLVDKQIKDELEENERNDGKHVWTFTEILGHKVVKPGDDDYHGSSVNVRVQWDDGSQTWEPLTIIGKDDPITCAEYALANDLLNEPGWKRFARLAKRKKKFKRMVNQARQKRKNSGPIFKFGVQIPRNAKEARILDAKNGNTLWQDAERKERDQIDEYETLKNLGKGAKLPKGYQMIRCHTYGV